MAEVELTEGWTAPVRFELLSDGAPENLTGKTVELLLYDSTGAAVDTTGDVAVGNPLTGEVLWNPDAPDLVAARSLYRFRFKVTDAGSKVAFFPKGGHASLRVYKA